MRAFIFPGQGSQAVGMGVGLAEASAEARAVFEEVDEALGQHLFRLMAEGPIEELTLTENAQPALMATSIAALRALEAEGVEVTSAAYVAGHSLGEYSALCAAGTFAVTDAARLLRQVRLIIIAVENVLDRPADRGAIVAGREVRGAADDPRRR